MSQNSNSFENIITNNRVYMIRIHSDWKFEFKLWQKHAILELDNRIALLNGGMSRTTDIKDKISNLQRNVEVCIRNNGSKWIRGKYSSNKWGAWFELHYFELPL